MCLYLPMLVYFSTKLLQQYLNLSLNQFFNGSLSDGTSVGSSLTSSLLDSGLTLKVLGSGLTPSMLGFGLTSRLIVCSHSTGGVNKYGWDNSSVEFVLRLSVRKLVSLKSAHGNNLRNLSISFEGAVKVSLHGTSMPPFKK